MTLNIAAYVGHAFAVAKAYGLARDVTFTHVSGTHNPATGAFTAPVTTTISGVATREEGDPEVYERLKLVELAPITLLFQPATPGETPPLGASVVWEGAPRIVKNVESTAPGGSSLVSRVVLV